MTPTVLVVEDQPALIELLGLDLHELGYRVLAAEGVEDACRIAGRESIDVVLLDVHLSDGSGLDILARLKATASQPAVIVMTGSDLEGQETEAWRQGSDRYLRKPVYSDTLRDALEKALVGRV